MNSQFKPRLIQFTRKPKSLLERIKDLIRPKKELPKPYIHQQKGT